MKQFLVSSSPHIRAFDNTSSIMFDVILALMPAMIAGTYFFGYRSVVVILISILCSVFFEYLWNLKSNKPNTIKDLSCVVSGLLLAFNLPVDVPLWIPVVGSFFMIIIVKMCFGGLGQNFLNPALAARAFLMASWPGIMTSFHQVGTKFTVSGATKTVDAITYSTPLAMIKGTHHAVGSLPSYLDLFMGNVGGCIGETSALALLIGAAYLILRRVISWRIPVTFILTVAFLALLFGDDPIYHILAGGLFLGAFFMATDYTSSPITPNAQMIYGIGCGILTFVIRKWGGYPEGVSYAILLMNVATPLLDKATPPRRYGGRIKQNA